MGFDIYATHGTAEFLNNNNIQTKKINKVLQGSPHIVEMISEKKISLVLNTTETPYYTTVSGANAVVMAIKAIKNNEISIKTIQSFGQLLS